MELFPINLRLQGRNVVIVGGGRVALQKCLSLLPAGAAITVIAPELTAPLCTLRDEGKIDHRQRAFAPEDLDGVFMIFAATDDPAVNSAVAAAAVARQILVAAVDHQERGNFTTPAILRRGELTIAVSTGGKSPALARNIRDQLAKRYGSEYDEALTILGAVREKLLTASDNTAYNKKILNDLAASELAELLKRRRYQEVDRLLTNLLGPGYTTTELGVQSKDRP